MERVRGSVNEELLADSHSSASTRQPDSIEALWRLKNEVRDDPELRMVFAAAAAKCVLPTRSRTLRPRPALLIDERVQPYQREFSFFFFFFFFSPPPPPPPPPHLSRTVGKMKLVAPARDERRGW